MLPRMDFWRPPTLLITVCFFFLIEIPHELVDSWSYSCALFPKAAEHRVLVSTMGEEQTDKVGTLLRAPNTHTCA